MKKAQRPARQAGRTLNPEIKRRIAGTKARLKQLEGAKLTRAELRELDWLQKSERAATIAAWQAAVPKGEYCTLAGRPHKLIDDAARTYDLPLGAATIDLRSALTAMHDLIAANAHKLRSDLSDDRTELEAEKLRQQIVGLERDNEKKLIDLLFAKSRAVPKESIQEALIWLSGRLQMLGTTLANIHPDARDQLADFLESLAIEIESGQLRF